MRRQDQWRIRRESLHGHGKGPYYAVALRKGRWGKGIRVSLGGYGWDRPLIAPHRQRYPGHCAHYGVGPFTVSIIRKAASEL